MNRFRFKRCTFIKPRDCNPWVLVQVFSLVATTCSALGADVATSRPLIEPPTLLTPPLRQAYRLMADDPVALLKPRFDPATMQNALIYHAGKIEALNPVSGEFRWSSPVTREIEPEWLATRDDLLLFSTRYQVFALDRRTGRTRWSFGQVPKDADSPAVDPEIFPAIAAQTMYGNLLVNVFQDRQAVALHMDGTVLWKRKLVHPPTGPIAMNDAFAIYVSKVSGQTVFVVLNALTGGELRTIRRDDQRQVQSLTLSPGHVLVAAGSDWVACYDPRTTKRLWSLKSLAGLRTAMLRGDAHALYLARDEAIAAYGLRDGKPLWRTPMDAKAAIATIWLDAGNLYVLSTRTLRALNTATGIPRWSTDVPKGMRVAFPLLTQSCILLLGSVEGVTKACFVERQSGHIESLTDLKGTEHVDDVQIFDHAMLMREGTTLTGWLAPSAASHAGP